MFFQSLIFFFKDLISKLLCIKIPALMCMEFTGVTDLFKPNQSLVVKFELEVSTSA